MATQTNTGRTFGFRFWSQSSCPRELESHRLWIALPKHGLSSFSVQMHRVVKGRIVLFEKDGDEKSRSELTNQGGTTRNCGLISASRRRLTVAVRDALTISLLGLVIL